MLPSSYVLGLTICILVAVVGLLSNLKVRAEVSRFLKSCFRCRRYHQLSQSESIEEILKTIFIVHTDVCFNCRNCFSVDGCVETLVRIMERNVWKQLTKTATENEERLENQWPLDANDEYLHGNKYKALIHERDFEGGKLIEINIQNCVDKSYKTFILLTPCFMNSKWSRHEASLAQMQEKAVFIRLKLDTEQEQELQEHLERDENKPIKHNLKTRTYLIWSGEKDDRRFWNQVAYLLEGGYSGYSGFFDGFKDTSSRVFRKLKQIFFSKEKEIVRHPCAISIPGPTPEPTPNQP